MVEIVFRGKFIFRLESVELDLSPGCTVPRVCDHGQVI